MDSDSGFTLAEVCPLKMLFLSCSYCIYLRMASERLAHRAMDCTGGRRRRGRATCRATWRATCEDMQTRRVSWNE